MRIVIKAQYDSPLSDWSAAIVGDVIISHGVCLDSSPY